MHEGVLINSESENRSRDFVGLPFVEDDLVGVKRTLVKCDWKKADKSEVRTGIKTIKYKYYSRSIILAVPSKRSFELFLQSNDPTQCLEYLQQEADVTTPQFKDRLKSLSEQFHPDKFCEDLDNINILFNLLIRVQDVELTKLFTGYLLGTIVEFNIGRVLNEQTIGAVLELLKSVPWQCIREEVLGEVVRGVGIGTYRRWLEISSATGFTEITDKIIERCFFYEMFVSFKHKNLERNLRQLWKAIFEEIQKSEKLREQWLEIS